MKLIYISIVLFLIIGVVAVIIQPYAPHTTVVEVKQPDLLIQKQEEIILEVSERLCKSEPIDCVVLIEDGFGLGSGVVISEDGIILTAGHMLEYGLPEKVTFKDGTEWTEFEALYVDHDVDIGLFKIKEVFQFPYLLPGDSNELEIGEEVWAIGMPFGLEWWHCYGKVSKETEKGVLYMSMALNPGNSGCPILNQADEIIGICTGGILSGNNIARGYTSNICLVIIAKYRILFEL